MANSALFCPLNIVCYCRISKRDPGLSKVHGCIGRVLGSIFQGTQVAFDHFPLHLHPTQGRNTKPGQNLPQSQPLTRELLCEDSQLIVRIQQESDVWPGVESSALPALFFSSPTLSFEGLSSNPVHQSESCYLKGLLQPSKTCFSGKAPDPLPGMAQHSDIARSAIMSSATSDPAALGDQRNMNHRPNAISSKGAGLGSGKEGATLIPPPKTVVGRALGNDLHSDAHKASQAPKGGVGTALADTPISTAPPSPQM